MMFLRVALLFLTVSILFDRNNAAISPERRLATAGENSVIRPSVLKVLSPFFRRKFTKGHRPSSTFFSEIEDFVSDFEDPEPENSHDADKRQFDDYGHLRFGKRGEFDDYGHLRFGRSLN